MDHLYLAYGLTFRSDCFLPGLQECTRFDKPPDVLLWFAEKPPWAREAKRKQRRLIRALPQNAASEPLLRVSTYGDGEFFEFVYADGSEFLFDGCVTRVWGTCVPPLAIEDLMTYLVGPVMGFMLRRRGMTPLHACAFGSGDSVVAICGAGGAGKSTTAAALALRGLPILCEDVSPLLETRSGFVVPPGYPRVCVWPESVRTLMGSSEALPQITPSWEKRYLDLDGRRATFAAASGRVSAIYFLEPRRTMSEAPFVEEVRPAEGVLELVKNSYMSTLLSSEQRAAEFDVFSRLVNSVLLRKITPHTDESKLSALCDLILDDASLGARRDVTTPVQI